MGDALKLRNVVTRAAAVLLLAGLTACSGEAPAVSGPNGAGPSNAPGLVAERVGPSATGVLSSDAADPDGLTKFGSVLKTGEWATVVASRNPELAVDRLRVSVLKEKDLSGEASGKGSNFSHSVLVKMEYEVGTGSPSRPADLYKDPLLDFTWVRVGDRDKGFPAEATDQDNINSRQANDECGLPPTVGVIEFAPGTKLETCNWIDVRSRSGAKDGDVTFGFRYRGADPGYIFWADPRFDGRDPAPEPLPETSSQATQESEPASELHRLAVGTWRGTVIGDKLTYDVVVEMRQTGTRLAADVDYTTTNCRATWGEVRLTGGGLRFLEHLTSGRCADGLNILLTPEAGGLRAQFGSASIHAQLIKQ